MTSQELKQALKNVKKKKEVSYLKSLYNAAGDVRSAEKSVDDSTVAIQDRAVYSAIIDADNAELFADLIRSVRIRDAEIPGSMWRELYEAFRTLYRVENDLVNYLSSEKEED